ncbi:MAG: hypothetical protein ACRDRJ_10780 [Streptosporangiaceae bacterium]
MGIPYQASPEVKVDLVSVSEPGQLIKAWLSAYELGTPTEPDRYIVLRNGPLTDGAFIRVESACIGHMFRLARCDCYDQLVMAMDRLADDNSYAIIYGYDQDGRANGPLDHIAAIKRMDEDGISLSQVYRERDRRSYQRAAFLIRELLGLSAIRLLTNNPDRLAALGGSGLEVERVPFEATSRSESSRVMRWKKDEEGHLLTP